MSELLTDDALARLAQFCVQADIARADLDNDFPVGGEARTKFREARSAMADAVPSLIASLKEARAERRRANFKDYAKVFTEANAALASLKREVLEAIEPFCAAYVKAGPEGTPGYAGQSWRAEMVYNTAPDHFRNLAELKARLSSAKSD